MSETREALAPCPFCGCKARILETQTDVVVACEGCCVENHFINDIRDTGRSRAIAAWNRRALSVRDERAEERGWMPIETAPKDGTDFIGAFFGIRWADSHLRNDVVRCWWQPEFEAFISSCREMTLAPDLTFEDGKSSKLHSPEIEPVTHWMPFPAPPAAIRAGGTDG